VLENFYSVLMIVFPTRRPPLGVGERLVRGDGGELRDAALRGGQQPCSQDLLDVRRPGTALGHGPQRIAVPR